MSNKARVILIDGMNAAHRFKHATATLTTPTGTPSGVVFCFVQMIKYVLDEFPDRAVVVAWESRECWRTALYSDYKAHRRTRELTPQEVASRKQFEKEQLPAVKEWLTLMGVPQISLRGYEADDVISFFALQRDRYDSVIVSSDSDMQQLVSYPDTRVFNPVRQVVVHQAETGEVMVSGRPIAASPHMLLWKKAVVGDSADGIKGVQGVGDITFDKMFAVPAIKGQTLFSYIGSHAARLGGNARGDALLSSQAILMRNMMLVDLSTGYRELGIEQCKADVPCAIGSDVLPCAFKRVNKRLALSLQAGGTGVSDGWRKDPSRALRFLRRWDIQEGVYTNKWKALHSAYTVAHKALERMVRNG